MVAHLRKRRWNGWLLNHDVFQIQVNAQAITDIIPTVSRCFALNRRAFVFVFEIHIGTAFESPRARVAFDIEPRRQKRLFEVNGRVINPKMTVGVGCVRTNVIIGQKVGIPSSYFEVRNRCFCTRHIDMTANHPRIEVITANQAPPFSRNRILPFENASFLQLVGAPLRIERRDVELNGVFFRTFWRKARDSAAEKVNVESRVAVLLADRQLKIAFFIGFSGGNEQVFTGGGFVFGD